MKNLFVLSLVLCVGAISAVRRQMVVDKFDKKLRNTFYSPRSFL